MEKNTKPVISVIMGVYNGERFLAEAVESILSQSYGDFEFIICNDCSTDASAEMLKAYAAADGRIVLLENEQNRGLAATLNRCIAVAKGEFIARMDCDDRALPERFAVQIQWLEQHPEADVLGTAVEYMDDNGDVYGAMSLDSLCVRSVTEVVRGSCVIHPTVMMRAEALRRVGGYTVNSLTTRAEDYDLWCKIVRDGGTIAVLPQILFRYREDQSNIVRRKYKYRIQEAKLKYRWIRQIGRTADLFYAVKPLLVGLLPLGLYKKLHKKSIIGTTAKTGG